MMKKPLIPLVLAYMLILLTLSCGLIKSEYQFDQTCEAPCWKGLTIGMSVEEVAEKLSQVEDYEITYKLPVSITLENKRGEINQLFFGEDLKTIALGTNENRIYFPVSILIKELGEPEYIIPMYAGFANNRLNAVLCYPEKGIVVELVDQKMRKDENGQDVFLILESTEVWGLAFDILDPNTSGIAVNYCKFPRKGTFQQEWTGYGEYLLNRPN